MTIVAASKMHCTDTKIVDIVAVIALFGFLNRFKDTMATALEASPIEAPNVIFRNTLVQHGWTLGEHAPSPAS